jgi:ribonuclease III
MKYLNLLIIPYNFTMNTSNIDIATIQSAIEYTFLDPHLLLTALTHRSYLNDRERDLTITEHNERLEFLGDAVLELVVTEHLFNHLQENEGVMTSLRSSLVNYKIMGKIGNDLGLDTKILLSKGEREELGKARLTIVADCMEAIIGALYIDGGIAPCKDFIHKNIIQYLPEIVENSLYKDYKTLMQELCQKHTKITPHYRVIATDGKDHEKTFTIGIWVGAEKLAEGSGRSKQDAETQAAQIGHAILLERFENSDDIAVVE